MKVLLDEMLPAAIAELLPNHRVVTATAAGFAGLSNGELVRRAIEDRFDVLVTADRGLPAQQNITVLGLAVVLIRGSRMADIEPQAAPIRASVAGAVSGTVTRVASA